MSWDPEVLTELCNETMSETNARDPWVFSWGLFAYADAPAAIGGGVGAFQWFKELPELLAFITDLSAAGFSTFDEEAEYQELRDNLRRIAAGYEVDPGGAVRAFNDELKTLLQISWIGQFDHLIRGEGAFPETVRARFRDDWDDEPALPSTDAIKEEERQAFMAFLNEYGI
jgi:hypothetical protein